MRADPEGKPADRTSCAWSERSRTGAGRVDDADVRALVADLEAQRDLARQSRELRERTDLLAEAMAEVFADDDDQQVELPVAERRRDG